VLEGDRFRAALDAMIDHVAIGRAVRDRDGRILDFEIVHVNAGSRDGAGRGPEQMVGGLVCEMYPAWRDSGMFELFAGVVETGEPYIGDRLEYVDTTPDGTVIRGWWDLRVTRFGDGYIAASRDVTGAVDAERAAAADREAASRERLAVELLQQAALPTELPEVPGAHVDAHYEAAGPELVVGGDWYDAVELPDGRLGLVIADVAGHGAGAAAVMVQVRNWLRALVLTQPSADPDAVVGQLNGLVRRSGSGLFVTCCFLTLDPASGDLCWSSAGHPPPLLLAGPASRLLSDGADGPPLGPYDTGYGLSEAVLGAGEAVVLYTDGLVERRGEALDVSLARLVDAAVTLGDDDRPSAALARLLPPGAGSADDVAVVSARLTS
jgi:hypothetical protein